MCFSSLSPPSACDILPLAAINYMGESLCFEVITKRLEAKFGEHEGRVRAIRETLWPNYFPPPSPLTGTGDEADGE